MEILKRISVSHRGLEFVLPAFVIDRFQNLDFFISFLLLLCLAITTGIIDGGSGGYNKKQKQVRRSMEREDR